MKPNLYRKCPNCDKVFKLEPRWNVHTQESVSGTEKMHYTQCPHCGKKIFMDKELQFFKDGDLVSMPSKKQSNGFTFAIYCTEYHDPRSNTIYSDVLKSFRDVPYVPTREARIIKNPNPAEERFKSELLLGIQEARREFYTHEEEMKKLLANVPGTAYLMKDADGKWNIMVYLGRGLVFKHTRTSVKEPIFGNLYLHYADSYAPHYEKVCNAPNFEKLLENADACRLMVTNGPATYWKKSKKVISIPYEFFIHRSQIDPGISVHAIIS